MFIIGNSILARYVRNSSMGYSFVIFMSWNAMIKIILCFIRLRLRYANVQYFVVVLVIVVGI